MQTKPRCCARHQTKVTQARTDVARIARVGAREDGRPSPRIQAKLAEAKRRLDESLKAQLEHDLDETLEHR